MNSKRNEPAALDAAWTVFRERAKEVEKYLDFIETIDLRKADGLASGGAVVAGYTMERDLIKTLRATGYLMIYNLTEATMTSAIDAIHQHIQDDEINFDDLIDQLQRVVLTNFKKKMSTWPVANVDGHPIAMAVARLGYERNKLFSGNLDARVIRDTADRYGFEIPKHNTRRSRSGHRMLEVKEKRNDLAHGSISFESCGLETSSTDLKKIFHETVVFLLVTLRGVRSFLSERRYLRNTPSLL